MPAPTLIDRNEFALVLLAHEDGEGFEEADFWSLIEESHEFYTWMYANYSADEYEADDFDEVECTNRYVASLLAA